MRKILLFIAVFTFILSGFAQMPQRGEDFKLLNEMKVKAPDISPEGADLSIINFFPGQTENVYFSTIGNTYFDTQTYNSGNLMNRIYSYPDETIGATWMHVGETGTPDRGTAYNYFDGTEWGEQQPHIGAAAKTGFPSYAPWGPNGEVVSHYQYISGDGPIKILRRETKGVGTWLESTLLPPAGNHSLVWHSMVTSGANHEFIHLLALVYDDPYLGQDDALLYYRSSDGGVTWEINGVVIEGLGDTYYPSIPSLKYSWAQPVGNTIAFTFGFDEFDGLVFKSNDNGTTWQKTVVYDSPYDPLDVPSTIDTYGSGDGTSAIVLDANGMAHVVFCRMLRSHSGTTWYYSPLGSEGVIYWNETMPALDSTQVSSYTLDNLLSSGNLVGWITGDVTIVEGQPDYGVSLTSQPQLSISPDGELGLVYTAVSPENKLESDYYRHLYFTRSRDGGSTWSEPYPLNTYIEFSFSECVFPALAPLYSSKMQVLFQEDYTPGTGEGNGLGEENFMTFLTLLLYTTDSKEFDKESGLDVSQNYPNPASSSTQVCINLKNSAHVSVRITDLPGKTLQVLDKGLLTTGINYLNIDVSSLKSGVYYYTIEADNQKVTRKLVVN